MQALQQNVEMPRSISIAKKLIIANLIFSFLTMAFFIWLAGYEATTGFWADFKKGVLDSHPDFGYYFLGKCSVLPTIQALIVIPMIKALNRPGSGAKVYIWLGILFVITVANLALPPPLLVIALIFLLRKSARNYLSNKPLASA